MSALVDRFVCRREGHKPCVTIGKVSGVTIESYYTTCLRCGKLVEVKV